MAQRFDGRQIRDQRWSGELQGLLAILFTYERSQCVKTSAEVRRRTPTRWSIAIKVAINMARLRRILEDLFSNLRTFTKPQQQYCASPRSIRPSTRFQTVVTALVDKQRRSRLGLRSSSRTPGPTSTQRRLLPYSLSQQPATGSITSPRMDSCANTFLNDLQMEIIRIVAAAAAASHAQSGSECSTSVVEENNTKSPLPLNFTMDGTALRHALSVNDNTLVDLYPLESQQLPIRERYDSVLSHLDNQTLEAAADVFPTIAFDNMLNDIPALVMSPMLSNDNNTTEAYFMPTPQGDCDITCEFQPDWSAYSSFDDTQVPMQSGFMDDQGNQIEQTIEQTIPSEDINMFEVPTDAQQREPQYLQQLTSNEVNANNQYLALTPQSDLFALMQPPGDFTSMDEDFDTIPALPITRLPSRNHSRRERQFRCHCRKAFFSNKDLKRHIAQKHSSARPFKCTSSLCKQSRSGFKRKDNCDRHIQACKHVNGAAD